MGLFDRLKDLTAPPIRPVRDANEIPPWLREAIPAPLEEPAPGAGAADGGVADPYRRAPVRGSTLSTRAAPPPEPPAYTPPPPVASPPPVAPPARTPPPAQQPWFAKTLPVGKEGGPVPWFARQQAGPAPASAVPAPAPPAQPAPAPAPPPQPLSTLAPVQPTAAPPAYSSPPAPPAAQPTTGRLLNRLIDLVLESWRSYPLDDETLSLLQVGLPYLTQRDCSRDAVLAGQTAARLGYIARAAEFSEYARARESDQDLFEELSECLEAADNAGGSIASAMAEFAADLVVSEPIDPPASDGGASWSVPGIDGSLRGRLRDRLLKGVPCPSDISPQDLQKTWKYGYFLRCTEEFFFDE